jgi:DNA-binding NtrC family response regulator
MSERLPRLLVLDDDETWLDQVPLILEGVCQVEGFPTIDQGLAAIESQFYDVILLDLNFDNDRRTGLDVFRRIHAVDSGPDVIVISGEVKASRIVEVLNAGVSRFIAKPAHPNEIRSAVASVLEERETRALVAKRKLGRGRDGIPLVGDSEVMNRLRLEIAQAVESGIKDILLIGETGTGKELVAQAIARQSDPSERFVAINCGGFTDELIQSELFGHVKGAFTGADRDKVGIFESAAGGFVFLDEIGEMPLHHQTRLLRVIQERVVMRVGTVSEKKVNFRTISATNVDLGKAMREGMFRSDLYYRLAKAAIRIPPLRERLEDVPQLTQYFLASNTSSPRKAITPESIKLLQAYDWPGNVRQLQAVVELARSRCKSEVIREKDICEVLPEVAEMPASQLNRSLLGRYGAHLMTNERKRYERAIIATRGDRTKAAQMLGVSRATFFRRAKELGLVRARILPGVGEFAQDSALLGGSEVDYSGGRSTQ